jgi:Arm DNA-binding domain
VITFDARTAKALAVGDHLTFEAAPGLRLVARETRRTWIYRYRSPVDGALRQIRMGHWPAMSAAAAVVAWEGLRARRDGGEDPATAKRGERQARLAEAQRTLEKAEVLTVAGVCTSYVEGYLRTAVQPKGYTEAKRMVATMLGEMATVPAAAVSRKQAFALISSYSGVPGQAAKQGQAHCWRSDRC